MGRTKIWKNGEYRSMKVKVSSKTFDRYISILIGKDKTIQEDLSQYIEKTINE